MNTKKSNHSEEVKQNALRYYLIGLNLFEVSKLTDVSTRTLEKWQKKYGWKDLKNLSNIKQRAYDLKKGGCTYDEISELLKIAKTTAHKYVKEVEHLKNS